MDAETARSVYKLTTEMQKYLDDLQGINQK